MSIETKHTDIIWNYVGTVVSMTSGLVLIPLLMAFLSNDELGLWYVYVAVANLAMLFEFGFHPTFARNIVYVISGERRLVAKGCDSDSIRVGIDYHLLNTVISASKLVYAVIASVVLIVLIFVGTAYINYITQGTQNPRVWISWALFCVSIFMNIFFLYSVTILRGYGDIAGESQARTFSKIAQLAVSAILLFAGFGLIGASFGYFISAVILRVFALVRIRVHADIEKARRLDTMQVSLTELRETFGIIGHVAWRDGVVQLCCYASTQAMSIISSLFLGLAATGTFSVLLQFASAAYSFAGAYPRSFLPAMQSAFVEGANEKQKTIVSSSIIAYWVIWMFVIFGLCVVVLPLLPLFKPGFATDYPLFLALSFYLALWNQQSLFCNYIISMNEVPYMMGYLVAAVLGSVLSWFFTGVLAWGAWGIVLGQALSQIAYNNWRWPKYLCASIGITYPVLLREGSRFWLAKIKRRR